MKKIVIVIVMILISGCANLGQPDYRMWRRSDGMSAPEKDKQECNYDAQKVFFADIGSPLRARFIGEQVFEACMNSRGYTLR